MGDGAVTVSERGVVLYANDRMTKVVGRNREELRGENGVRVPVLASVTGLEIDGAVVRCLIVADLTDQRRAAAAMSEARQQLLRKKLELEEEYRLKETLQRAVPPASLPECDGFRLAARYLPVDRPSLVGGDWYDAFLLPDGSLALAVGDVVGHDLDADMAALLEAAGGWPEGRRSSPAPPWWNDSCPRPGTRTTSACSSSRSRLGVAGERPVSSLRARETAGRPYC
jgi:hypothetical protein